MEDNVVIANAQLTGASTGDEITKKGAALVPPRDSIIIIVVVVVVVVVRLVPGLQQGLQSDGCVGRTQLDLETFVQSIIIVLVGMARWITHHAPQDAQLSCMRKGRQGRAVVDVCHDVVVVACVLRLYDDADTTVLCY